MIKKITSLIKEADRVYSLLVRQRSANDGVVKCVTCGKRMLWRRSHLGHFMVRQRMPTRYDDENTGVQCVNCNTFHEGEQFKFSQYIDRIHGRGTAEQLQIKSGILKKFTRFELEELIKGIKQELKVNGFILR